jgi:hypothetical protein
MSFICSELLAESLSYGHYGEDFVSFDLDTHNVKASINKI